MNLDFFKFFVFLKTYFGHVAGCFCTKTFIPKQNHFSDFFVKTTSFFCFDNYNQVFPDIAKKEILEKIRKLNFKLESNFVENDDIFHSCWWSSSTMLTFQLATVATKSVWLPWKFFSITYIGQENCKKFSEQKTACKMVKIRFEKYEKFCKLEN